MVGGGFGTSFTLMGIVSGLPWLAIPSAIIATTGIIYGTAKHRSSKRNRKELNENYVKLHECAMETDAFIINHYRPHFIGQIMRVRESSC